MIEYNFIKIPFQNWIFRELNFILLFKNKGKQILKFNNKNYSFKNQYLKKLKILKKSRKNYI